MTLDELNAAYGALQDAHAGYGRVLEQAQAAWADAGLSGLVAMLEAETRKHCRELTEQVEKMKEALGRRKKPGRPRTALDPVLVILLGACCLQQRFFH